MQKLSRTSKQQRVRTLLSLYPCVVCGEDHPVALQFHHLDPKIKDSTVSAMLRVKTDWTAIVAEIEKCAILCSNCHIKVHRNVIPNNFKPTVLPPWFVAGLEGPDP